MFFLIFTELSTKEVSLKRITNSTNPSCTVILYNPSWPSSGRWGRYISSSLTVNERYTSWIMYMDIYKHTFIVTKWHKVLYSISRLISIWGSNPVPIFRQVMDFTNIQRIMYEVRHCGDWDAWEGGLGGIKKNNEIHLKKCKTEFMNSWIHYLMNLIRKQHSMMPIFCSEYVGWKKGGVAKLFLLLLAF